MTTPPADGASELLLMLLADARLPTSGHAYSGGLEGALLGGLPPDEIVGYCRTRLATVTFVDAATAVLCRGRALSGLGTADVEQAWAARTPSEALREAARALGRANRRLALRLWPASPALEELVGLHEPARPRVLGLMAAAGGLSAAQLVRLVGYDDVQSVLSASLKLCPGDPVDAATALLELAPEIEALVPRCVGVTEPSQLPAPSAPVLEAWAQAHAVATRRLFRA